MSGRPGVLLVNLGTPDRPDAEAVGRYLREFLGDPRVIDLAAPLRWFLVNVVIVPRRAEASAANYRKVWTEAGSPLLRHSEALLAALAGRVDAELALAMRYGRPSIRSGLAELRDRGVEDLLVLPLFPQWAEATTGSVVAKVEDELRRGGFSFRTRFVTDFADHPAFVRAQAELVRREADLAAADALLMSFHGLPERQIKKADASGRCLADPLCCARAEERNRRCYRARCFATARALAAELGLAPDRYEVTFQSRLGRAKWIEPYTDRRVAELLAAGRRRFVVVSPAFVADCIETIEELGMSLREQIEAGGGTMELVSCVNASPAWVAGLSGLLAAELAAGT